MLSGKVGGAEEVVIDWGFLREDEFGGARTNGIHADFGLLGFPQVQPRGP